MGSVGNSKAVMDWVALVSDHRDLVASVPGTI